MGFIYSGQGGQALYQLVWNAFHNLYFEYLTPFVTSAML